jgi:protocatechuate 3,4-dioxygenase beta subunit
LVWLLLGAISSRHLCRAAFAAPDFAQQQLQCIVGSLARMPRLLVSRRITTAAAWGVLQPTILLPSQAVDPKDLSALRMLLAHEWSHIRRRDLWLLALGRLLLVLLFAHPFFWLIRRRIRTDQELIADAMAADSFGRLQYAENLVAWARRQPPARFGLTGALGIWERPGHLTRRIAMLVDERVCLHPQCSHCSRWTIVLVSAALLFALSLVTLRPPPAAMANSTSDSGQVTVAGRIVDTQGKSIARADVYLREQPTGWTSSDWQPSRSVNLAKTKTDGQGEYRFENVSIPLDKTGQPRVFPLDLIAVADGYAVAWRHIPVQNPREPIQLTLQPESVLQGKLLADSQPIAGAQVRAYRFTPLDQPASPRETGPRAGHDEPNLKSPGYLDLRWSEIPLTAQTDREGRFTLGRLPKDVRVVLVIDDERFVRREVYAATTDQPQLNLPDAHNEPVRTDNFTIDLEPGHQALVRVVYDDTGAPVPHAGVAYGGIVFPPQYSTDDKGRFTARQLPAGEFRMWIYAPGKSDYLGVVTKVAVPREDPQEDFVVRLPRGAIVEGKVLDEKTGGGVGGVNVSFLNQANDQPSGLLISNHVTTDGVGAFRLAVAPGNGEVAVFGRVPGYVTWQSSGSISESVPMKHRRAVAPSLAAPVVGVEIRLTPVATYTGQTVDSQGKPVAARIRSTLVVDKSGGYFPLDWSTDAQYKFKLDGLFTASEVNTNAPCEVIFTNQERKLAAVIELFLPNPDKALVPFEVKLRPMGSVEGTVLGFDNRPLAGATVKLLEWSSLNGHGYGEPHSAPTTTDSKGHFKFDTLISGLTYSVMISADGYKMPVSWLTPPNAYFQGIRGELKQLGEIHMLPVAKSPRGS